MQNSEVYITCSKSLKDAVKVNKIEDVKELINKGADVNEIIEDGMIVLHIAADFGYLQIIELLLENGANIDAKDKYGKTLICSAIQAIKRGEREHLFIIVFCMQI